MTSERISLQEPSAGEVTYTCESSYQNQMW
jgi:hypothetical protein